MNKDNEKSISIPTQDLNKLECFNCDQKIIPYQAYQFSPTFISKMLFYDSTDHYNRKCIIGNQKYNGIIQCLHCNAPNIVLVKHFDNKAIILDIYLKRKPQLKIALEGSTIDFKQVNILLNEFSTCWQNKAYNPAIMLSRKILLDLAVLFGCQGKDKDGEEKSLYEIRQGQFVQASDFLQKKFIAVSGKSIPQNIKNLATHIMHKQEINQFGEKDLQRFLNWMRILLDNINNSSEEWLNGAK